MFGPHSSVSMTQVLPSKPAVQLQVKLSGPLLVQTPLLMHGDVCPHTSRSADSTQCRKFTENVVECGLGVFATFHALDNELFKSVKMQVVDCRMTFTALSKLTRLTVDTTVSDRTAA